jgi:hypothetical protein
VLLNVATAVPTQLGGKFWIACQAKESIGKALGVARGKNESGLGALDQLGCFALSDKDEWLAGC